MATAGWCALALIVVLTVLPGLLPGNVFASTNILTQSPTYWSVTDTMLVPGNVLVSDTVDSVLPRTILMHEAMSRGDLAFWDPYQLGGGELAGLPNGAYLSPLSLPYFVLPMELAPAVVKLLEIAVIALGSSLFLRRLGITRAAWPLASIIYASSGFMVAWTGWPQTRVAAFIPLLFWAVEKLIASRKWTAVPILSVVLACMWLGGFPGVTVNAMYVVTAYAVVRALTLWHGSTRERVIDLGMQALRYGAGVVGSLALAAIHLLPFALNASDVVDFAARQTQVGAILQPVSLSSTVLPYVMGLPDATGVWIDVNVVELFNYAGAGALALACLALLLWRRVGQRAGIFWFFPIVTILVTAAMFWGGPLLALIQDLPALGTSLFGRMRSVSGFLIAVMAAFGLQVLLRPARVMPVTSRRARILDLLGWATAVFVAYMLFRTTVAAVVNSPSPVFAERWIVASFICVVAIALFVALLRMYPVAWLKVVAGTAVLVIVAVPAAHVMKTWWTVNDADTFYPDTQATTYLEDAIGENRVISYGNAIYMGTSSVYEIRMFGGRGFMTSQWRDLITEVQPSALLTPTYASFDAAGFSQTVHDQILDRYGVAYALVPSNVALPGEVEDEGGNAALPIDLGSDAGQVTASGSGPLRGVMVHSVAAENIPPQGVTLLAEIVAPNGEVLASNTQQLREIDEDIFLAFDADELDDDQAWELRLSTDTPDASIELTSAADDDAEPEVDVLRPIDDGLNVVLAGDVTILERDTALDRIRWASSEVVKEDPQDRLDYLADDAEPDEVVLESPTAEAGGGDATVTVEQSDDLDITNVKIEADGPGWVVIADSMRRSGWTATLNGEPAELLPAEHAGAAVYVPAAGSYELKLKFSSPGFVTGAVVTGASLAAMVAVWVGIAVVGRRRRAEASGSGAGISSSRLVD
ncbi:YfhO family protein [Gulosibacter massiliensis]|uniref:YfhO family protein n=1 Tax=Gulosibacter massiliensis TaxID=2479839 RepID=UPI0013DE1224|nr:YfhO family protein [Gulosibacter massiliensis]